ncbi:hypothetical protein [Streptomyces sp. NPDC004065]|uniref:hypothetical protein n=1 Tax=Streptomyces sp. NPDC004065 TaxID=3364689 RepID=UPI00384CD109
MTRTAEPHWTRDPQDGGFDDGGTGPGATDGATDDGATADGGSDDPATDGATANGSTEDDAPEDGDHICGAGPASAFKVGGLMALAFGVCLTAVVSVVWILLWLLGEDPWPPLGWGLVLAVPVVLLEAVAGAVVAGLGATLFTLLARRFGGLRLTLADAPADTATPASAGDPAAVPLPDAGRALRRLRARLGFPPRGWGQRYVDFVDGCSAAGRRLAAAAAPLAARVRTVLVAKVCAPLVARVCAPLVERVRTALGPRPRGKGRGR